MSIKKPLDEILNVGPRPIRGDAHTVCQISGPPRQPDNIIWSPSYRHIIDFADLSKAVWICPPGQSGNLSSLHYSDLFEKWATGEYIPMLWTKEQVEKNKDAMLLLMKK
jgi:penicillin amidase